VDVDIQFDTAPRKVRVPTDLGDALAHDSTAWDFFETLSYTHRKEWVRWVHEAKEPETRAARIAKTVAALRAGNRTR
jgi:uncharacterized protein YdeI (YjbR/CyaY-like superfamily)